MPPGDLLGLREQLPRIAAQRELLLRSAQGTLTSQGVYDLFLAATGSEQIAESRRTDHLSALLRAGVRPE